MNQSSTINTGVDRTIVDSALLSPLRFARRRWLPLLLISVAVLVPCFWHVHIEAGDLGSHTYNAWLVQLIHQGQAPGLRVERIWQNVLFDWLLSGFGSLLGFSVGEKIAVCLAVLLVFWSTFAFIYAVSGTVPWTLVPAIAMVSYGWTFNAGFFNYYLSIGLSFLGLAIVWRAQGWRKLYGLALTPLILVAHPLGLAWFCAAGAYIVIAERVPLRWHVALLAISGLLLLMVDRFMRNHFRVGGSHRRVYKINGLDQIVVYSDRYKFLAATLFLFVVFCFLCDIRQRHGEAGYWSRLSLPLQLYVVVEMGVLLLPGVVYLPLYAAPLSLLLERMSLLSAILALSMLGILRQKAWHLAGFAALACMYFSLLYQDTARISSMETQVERLVKNLPPYTHVLATIVNPPKAPIYVSDHIVDRACIERCFSFENYEPASDQFRVRAEPGNRIVTTSARDSGKMEDGDYIVQRGDLPAFQIYQCTPLIKDLCITKLEAGERNDQHGVHP